MKFVGPKKLIVLVAAILVLAAAAGGSYAYWSSTGSGAGSATAGSATGNVNIALKVDLHPGIVPGGSEPVDFSATNAGPTQGVVHTIAFVSVTDPGDTSPGSACSAYLTTYGTGPSSDFSMATVTETAPGTVVPVVGTTALGSGTLHWANNPSQDQTPCSGQDLQLNVGWS